MKTRVNLGDLSSKNSKMKIDFTDAEAYWGEN